MASSSPTESMEQFIAALPKAELHVHLEGAIEAIHLARLAMRHQTELAAGGESAVQALYATRDFASFLNAFKTVCQHLQTPLDYEFVTYRVLRRMARQNIRYAEVILSAGVMLWQGQDIVTMFTGVDAGARQARQEFGIRAQWIFDAVRQFPVDQAWTVARAAAKLRSRGVIGMGIGGDEAAAPAELFKEIYDFAREQGLRLVAHAGETVGPESIWGALQDLGAERIGHGLTAIKDARLVEHLASKQIPLEICLTSNLRTGGIADFAEHPLRQYFDRGLNVSLHSDDPTLFGTDLNREYLLAHQNFGFNRSELRRLAINSFEAAFLPPEEKQSYLAAFSAEV
ncbi:MAG: adenosine deaminase [Acidobacteria bacterium]|nr:adenosine deaminase [Acidobacteriota bacterium]